MDVFGKEVKYLDKKKWPAIKNKPMQGLNADYDKLDALESQLEASTNDGEKRNLEYRIAELEKEIKRQEYERIAANPDDAINSGIDPQTVANAVLTFPDMAPSGNTSNFTRTLMDMTKPMLIPGNFAGGFGGNPYAKKDPIDQLVLAEAEREANKPTMGEMLKKNAPLIGLAIIALVLIVKK